MNLRDEASWLVAAGKIKGNVHLVEASRTELSLEEKLRSMVESRALILWVTGAAARVHQLVSGVMRGIMLLPNTRKAWEQ